MTSPLPLPHRQLLARTKALLNPGEYTSITTAVLVTGRTQSRLRHMGDDGTLPSRLADKRTRVYRTSAVVRDAYRNGRLLLPGYLTLECATDLLDVVPEEAGRVLKVLTEAGVLHRTEDGTRWAIHDRVRPTLTHQASAEQRSQAVERLAVYYRLRSAALEDLLNPWRYRIDTHASDLAHNAQQRQGTVWFTSEGEAMAWADTELQNLPLIVEMFADLGRAEAWQLTDLIGTYINKRRPLALARTMYAAALRAAQHQDNPAALGILHRRLALVAENPRQKLEHSQAALESYTVAEHERGIATGHEGLGDAHLDLGDIDTAVWHLREAVRLHEQLGNARGLSMQRRKLGQLIRRQGAHEEALELIVHAHRTQADLEVPDRHQMARSAAALIEIALSHAETEQGELTPVERAALLMVGQTGVTLMREDGALHRQAQMREQVADLTLDPEHEHTELTAALALHKQLAHPDTTRVRTRLELLEQQ